jgi:hypothetical protein
MNELSIVFRIMSTPAPPPAAPAITLAATTTGGAQEPLPNPTCLVQAAKLAIQHDKPIQLDYYVATHTGSAFLGEDAKTKERVLVKSKEEFTSLIQKLYKVGEDYIIMTENSIYVVSGKLQKRKVDLAALQADE